MGWRFSLSNDRVQESAFSFCKAIHAEEKAALETEKQQLEERSKTLSTEIAELDKQINAAMSQVDGLKLGIGPAEEESDALRGQVKYLESRRAQLGVFAGKETDNC